MKIQVLRGNKTVSLTPREAERFAFQPGDRVEVLDHPEIQSVTVEAGSLRITFENGQTLLLPSVVPMLRDNRLTVGLGDMAVLYDVTSGRPTTFERVAGFDTGDGDGEGLSGPEDLEVLPGVVTTDEADSVLGEPVLDVAGRLPIVNMPAGAELAAAQGDAESAAASAFHRASLTPRKAGTLGDEPVETTDVPAIDHRAPDLNNTTPGPLADLASEQEAIAIHPTSRPILGRIPSFGIEIQPEAVTPPSTSEPETPIAPPETPDQPDGSTTPTPPKPVPPKPGGSGGSGGGGSSGGGGAVVTPADPITLYAESNTNPAPVTADYEARGVTGVTDDNVEAINTAIDAAGRADVDAAEKVQAIVDAMLRVIAYAEDSALNPAPDALDFSLIHVTGVTAANLTGVQAAIEANDAVNADAVAEIQAIVDGMVHILDYAADAVANPAPTVADYAAIGVTGVDAAHLDAVNSAIDAVPETAVETPLEVQSVADAMRRIYDYAADSTAAPAPSLGDFSAVGVTGVTASNLAPMLAAVAAQPSAGADSVAELQALVDTTAPVVTAVTSPSVDNLYRAGDVITIEVTLSEVVTVDTTFGSPTLLLETGGTDRQATYVSGSGTNTLVFTYTVQPGDMSPDLNYAGTNALAHGNALITDAFGNTLDLTLPDPASAESLAGSKALEVDSLAPPTPTITGLDAASDTGVSATDRLTQDTTPTLTGTTLPNLIVEVYDGATLLGSTTADGTGAWSFTAPALTDGSHELKAKAIDALGNDSPFSTGLAIEIDTAAPGAPVIVGLEAATDSGASDADSVTNDATPTLVGTAEADTRVEVFQGTTSLGIATADSSGNWTLALGAPLTTGVNSLTARALDAAGNMGAASVAKTVTVDPAAPSAPVIAGLTAASDSGTSSSDRLTNVTTPTLTGSAEADAEISVYAGATLVGTTTAGADGTWSFTVPIALTEGAHSFTATATDLAGNTGAASAALVVTLDLAADVPVVTGLDAASDTGLSTSDNITADDTPTLVGTAEAGTLVHVYDGATLLGTTTADGTGAWSLAVTTPFAGGSHALTATSTDAAGNVSAASGVTSVVVDNEIPLAPIVTGLSAATDLGFSSSDRLTSQTTPAVVGTSEANARIEVYDGATLLGTTTADASGAWSFTPAAPLAAGSHSLTARAIDPVSNVSPASTPTVITIDVTVPGAPTFNGLTAGTDTGANAADGITGNATPTLVGTGEAGTRVEAFDGTTSLGTATVDAGGNWSIALSAPLTAGDHAVTVKAMDAAGNLSAASAPRTITIDTGAPIAPVVTGLAPASDTGASTTDGITSQSTPTLVGTAEAGARLQVFDGATLLGTTTADGTGAWSFLPGAALAAGAHTVTVVATDASGNVSATSAPMTVVVDATPPGAATLTGLTASTDTGPSNSDNVTGNATPTVAGTAEPYATVAVFDGGTLLGTTTANASGAWAFTPGAALSGGTHTLTAQATDAAGNPGPMSAATTVTIDASMPAVPTVTGLTLATDTGASATDGITANTRPTLTGTGDADALVQVYDGTTLLGTVTADGTGAWSFTPASSLASGPHSLTVRAVNASGNQSAASAPVVVTIDTSAPGLPVITGLTTGSDTGAADGITSQATPTLSGTAEADATLSIYDGATLLGTVSADGTGAWSFTPGTALGAGPHVLTAVAGDLAGHQSAPSAPLTVTVDAAAPAVPVIAGLTASTDTGASDRDGVTSNASPTLTGTAEPFAVVELFDGGTAIGTTTADALGQWSFVPAAPLSAGAHSLTATATDAAGNTSASSASAIVTIDAGAPGLPVITGLLASTDTGVSATDGLTRVAMPTLVGTADAGATVLVYEGATLLGSVVADGGGNWSLALKAALSAGAHGVTARAVDTAGNLGTPSTPFTITFDAAGPATPVITGLTATTDTGASATDGVTSQAAPTLTGTSEPDAVILIREGTTILGTTTADGTGAWSFTPGVGLSPGSHSLTAIAADAAGNTSGSSTPMTVVVDGAAPGAPVILGLTTASDTGVSATDSLTSHTSPTLTGTAEPGATVEVHDGATLLGSTTADAGGAWSFTPSVALASGAHTLTATAIDAAGRSSVASSGLTVHVDTTADGAPSITGLTALTDLGSSSTDGVTPMTTPTIVGTAEAGATVQVFDGGVAIGTTAADGSGNWSLVPTAPLAVGTHNLTASYVDRAGNASGASAPFAVTIDATPPGLPTLTGLAAGSDSGASATDALTNITTPTLVGTAEANATVSIFDGTVLLGTATADGTGAWSFTPGTALSTGSHTLTVVAVDAAGNVSAGAAPRTIQIDAAAPAAPSVSGLTPATDTGVSATDGVTSIDTPTVTGTAEAHATVQVFDGATLLGTVTATAAGAWSLALSSPLADGAHPLSAVATDAAGNVSAASVDKIVTVDSTPPAAPVITGLTLATDTGASSADGVTANATPTLQGTAEPGATVQIFEGTTLLGTTVADGAGTWAYTPTAALTAGSHTFKASIIDLVGNTSPDSAPHTVTVDAVAPTAPTLTGLAPGADTGTSATDGLTREASPALVGTAEAGATVSIFDGTSLVGTTTADGTGNWSFTPGTALAAGAHTLTVVTADAAGNVSAVSAAQVITVDAVAPAVPVLSGLTPGTDTGTSVIDGVTANATPTFMGTAEPGVTVTVSEGATELGTATADASGNWSFTPTTALAAGDHVITLQAVDAAGNASAASGPQTFTIDGTGPATPAITGLTASTDTGASATDGLTANATPAVTGTAEPGALIRISEGATLLGTTTANGAGLWTFTPPGAFTAGSHTLTAQAVDGAGNTSAASSDFTLTVDTSAPGAPTLTGITAATDTGASSADRLTTHATPTFVGMADANGLVQVYDGSTLLGTATADGTGAWSFTPTTALSAGVHSVRALGVDGSGNASAASAALSVTIDPAAPAAPVLTGLATGSDSGFSATDAVTSDTTPTLTGTAEAGATIRILDGTTLVGTVVADAAGAWSFTPGALSAGAHSFTATATDPTGSVSPASAALTVTVDATAPGAPVVTGLSAATDTGSSPTDRITSHATPTIVGTAEANATVQIFDAGTLIGSTTADGTGAWSFTPSTPLTASGHTLTARAVDAAGNSGAVSASRSLTIDQTAPGVPTVNGITAATDTGSSNSDGITSHVTPVITGTAEAGSTVNVYDGATLLGTVTATAGGTWSLTPGTALAAGSHSLTAVAADTAGNLSAVSVAKTIAIDPGVPSAPVISGLAIGVDTGGNTEDSTTKDDTPTLYGTADPNATVKVFEGATLVATLTADAAGAWSFTPTTALSAGNHTYTATATDVAGNVSPASAAKTITIDPAVPNAPVITGLTAATDTGLATNDSITYLTLPTLSGTAEANATVRIYDGAVLLGTAAASGTGAWSFTPATPLTHADHTITAEAVDASGNVSPVSAPLTLTVDTVAPVAPVITGLDALSDLGESATDEITSDTTPTMVGTAEANARINVYNGGTLLGTATADGTGAWSYTPSTLVNGTHTLTARAIDTAGNEGPLSAALVVQIDSVKPPVPVITGLTEASDSGRSYIDNNTTDTTPTIVGTAEAGVKVELFDAGVSIGITTADANGNWSFTPTLAEGTHAITAKAFDTAGGLSNASAVKSVVVDVTNPVAPVVTGLGTGSDTGSSTSDGITNDLTPQIKGTAEPNATVQVYDNGTLVGTVQAAANGTWTLDLTQGLGHGPHAITAKATDAAGNAGPTSAAYNFTLDLVSPAAPVMLLNPLSDTGPSNSDGITDDTTPTVSGTAEVGSTVRIYDNGTLKGTVTPDAGGNWTYTSTALTAGDHVLTATATDLAGNVSASSNPIALTIDTTSLVPTVTGLDPVTDTGAENDDAITSNTRPTLEGTAEAYTTVTIFDGTTVIGTTIADKDGDWTFTPTSALSTGNHVIKVSYTDAAGNPSALSVAKTVVIDTTGTAAPVITGLTAATDKGPSSTDRITDDSTPTLQGTSEPNATVQIYNGTTLIGSTTAAANGTWTYTPSTLAARTHSFTAVAVDLAGNAGPSSAAVAVTIDTTNPSEPKIWGLTPATDTGESNSDGVTSVTKPTFTGTAEPGTTITLLNGTTPIGTTTAGASGAWTVTSTQVLSGTESIKVSSTDLAGNSDTSTTFPVTIITGTTTVSEVKSAVTGTFDPGEKITIQVVFTQDVAVDTTNGVPTLQLETGTIDRLAVYTSGSGTDTLVFTYTVQPGDTSTDLNYKATNSLALNGATLKSLAGGTVSLTLPATTDTADSLAGNESLKLSNILQSIPKITGLKDDTTDTGRSYIDSVTKDTTPTLVGVGPASTTIEIYEGTSLKGTTTTDAAGNWSLTLGATTATTHNFKARTSVGAVKGTFSPTVEVTVDITVAAPVVSGLTPETDLGTSATDSNTSVTTPVIKGTSEADAIVEVYDGATLLGKTLASGTGAWTFQVGTAFSAGAHVITAKAIDVAGNTSAASAPRSVTIETGDPAAPVITGITAATDTGTDGDGITSDTTPTFTGTAQAGTKVELFDGAVRLGDATAAANGTWTITSGVSLAAGSHSIVARGEDLAGNTSPDSAAKTIVIEASKPKTPTISGLTAATDTGVSATDLITTDTTPTVYGTADPNVTIQVLKGTTVLGTTTTDSAGRWSVAITAAQSGTVELTARATDVAGNVSNDADKDFEFDVTRAAVTSVTSTTSNDEVGIGEVVTIRVVFDEVVAVDTTNGVPTLLLETGTTDRAAVYTSGSGTNTLVFTYVVQPGDTSADLNYKATNSLALNGAVLTDLAGNAATAASLVLPALTATSSLQARNIAVDTTVPAAPVITGLTTATDSGASDTDAVTSDATPNVMGTAEPGAKVELYDGATLIGTDTVSSTGAWQVNLSTQTTGLHSLTARTIDPSGNTSAVSNALIMQIDTTDPTGHTLAGLTRDTDSGPSPTDGITSDTTPTFTGKAEAFATVDIYRSTSKIGTTTADASGQWSFTPTTALTEGTHSISIKVTDLAGNLSAIAPTYSVEIDKTAPNVPVLTGLTAATDTGTSNSDLLTKDTTPTFTGSAQAGVTVLVYDGAALLGQATAGGTGAWSFTPTAPLANGPHSITVKAMDEAGNTSAATAAKTVTIDAALSVPEITGLLASTDTGSSTLDGITTQTKPTLTGKADPGTTVQVLDGTTVLGTATASGAGAWSFTPTNALAAGNHTFTAKATDAAGNASAASVALAVTVDATAPAAPIVTGLAAATDHGVSPADGITNDATPTLVGTAEPFATVKIMDGATVVGTVTADEAGLWSFTPTAALAATTHTWTATATDVAGNLGAASSPVTIQIDLTAPAKPVITGLLAGTDTGASATDGATSHTTPTLTGTAEANAVIQVLDGTTVVGSTTASGTGAWSFTFTSPLATGAHTVTVTAMDTAGNVSVASAAKTLTIDGTAPTLPVITGLTAATDTGASATDGITSATKPAITGTAEAGATVQIFDGATLLGSATANASGTWTYTPTTALSAGSHAITAKAVDTAGNIGPTTGVWTLVVDPAAPATPVIAGLTPASDTGASQTDGITTQATPTLVGTAEANATVQILEGTTVLGTTTADGAGNWSFTPTTALASGSHTLTAKAVDLAGNTSAGSGAKTVVIDAGAPSAPVITGLTASTDTGASTADGVTRHTTPTLTGTAEANVRIEIRDGVTLLGTTTADGTGAWSFTPSAALSVGPHAFTATAVDAAGNGSPASGALAVTVDVSAPATPTFPGLTAATDTGASSADGLTSNATPTLTGTAEAGAIVQILDGTTLLGTATADGTGAWSFTPTTALANGSHHLTAVATDLAGNASAATIAKTVVIDAAVPVTPVFTGLTAATDSGASNADGITSQATPTLAGTAEAGTTVQLLDGATPLGTVVADAAGNWSFTPGTALAAGDHVITVTSLDAAGNLSAASAARTVTIDASAAAAPVITGLSAATDTGTSGTDGITRVAAPAIVGTGEPNAAVKVFDGATLLGTTAADAAGNWSFTPTTPLAAGPHTITATMTDLAGNTSPASTALVVTIDTATPVTPTLTGLTAATDTGASATDSLTSNAAPTLTGTAEAGTTVSLYDGATLLGTTTATGAGTWSFTPGAALAGGSHTLTVTASDASGNVSAASVARTVVIDATAPVAPTVAGLTAATDTGASNADGVTSNDTPTLTGTAEAGSTVKVYDGATLLGTVAVDAAGTWSLSTPLAEGAHSVTATATDAAGNVSAASVARAISVDTTAPAAPVVTGLTTETDLGTSAADRLTANARPTIVGTAESGATVQVFADGTLIGSTTADGTGAWSLTPAAALSAGAHAITASFTDLIGNTSPTSAAVTVTIDVTGPAAPVITGLTAATDTGASATDGLTANATPTLTGTTEPDAAIAVYDGAVLLGTTSADGTGAWSFTPGAPLAAGPHALTAIATDTAGNLSPASAVTAIAIDGAAPLAPVVTGLTAATDTGASPTDGLTSHTTPTFTGTTEAGSTVRVFEGATLIATTTADVNGAWQVAPTSALSAGVHAITATATDAAGRVSAASAASTITIVAAAPGTPVITGLTAATDTGDSATDAVTTHSTPTLTGTAIADATVQVFEGTTLLGTTTADGAGDWSLAVTLTDGSHGLTAVATSPAGNVSATSIAKTVVVDLTAPTAPVITGLTAATDTGTSATDGITGVSTPTLTGTAAADSRVDLYDGATLLGTTTADGTGAWSFTPGAALAAGSHTITAQAVDTAGNTSAYSSPKAIVIETGAPAAPIILGLTAATDTGNSATDGITSHATPTVVGTAAPGALVEVFDGATSLGTVTADGFGQWSFTPATALAAGSHPLTATASTAGGATSAASAATAIVVTTAGPAAATILGLTAASDSGASTTDGLTSHPTPTLQGTAGANATVKVFDGGTLLGTTTADNAGAWTFTPPSPLTTGDHSFTASAIDAAGNNGALSAAVVVTVDVAAPNAPVVTGLTAVSDTGVSATDGVTSEATPTIVGTAEAGASVQVFDGTTLLGTVTADGAGAWTLTPGAALAAGSHAISAVATDGAGNASASAIAFNVVVTGNAPAAPVIAGLTPATDTGTSNTDGVTGLTSPTLTGTAPAHASVQVFEDGTLVGATTADASGTWTFAFSNLSAGSHSLTATATDAAGRVSAVSAVRAIVINAGTPGAPVITGLTAASDTGASSSDGITSVAAPTLVGMAEANATVSIFDGATLLDTVTASATGDWSLTLSSPLSAGVHALTATVTSASGTPGGTSAPYTLEVDLTNPAAPTLTGGGVTQDATPTLSGTAEADSLVSIYDGATLLGTTTASGTGTWSFVPSADLTEGDHNLAATATDAAGHLSEASAFVPLKVDTTAPAAPTLSAPATTSDATPTLTGTAEAGATVRIFDGGTLLGTAIADSNGDWTYTPGTDLALGSHTLTARAVDTAGNLGPASAGASLEVEAPSAGYQIGGDSLPLWFDAGALSDAFELSMTVAQAGPQQTLQLSDVLSMPIASEGVLLGGDPAAPVGGEAPGFFAPEAAGMLLDSDVGRYLG